MHPHEEVCQSSMELLDSIGTMQCEIDRSFGYN